MNLKVFFPNGILLSSGSSTQRPAAHAAMQREGTRAALVDAALRAVQDTDEDPEVAVDEVQWEDNS
jgi:hypothetical protein